MTISIDILSGLTPKAPAAIILRIAKRKFLLDAGACIGSTEIPWQLPSDVDAVFISHDHHDHIGGATQLPHHIPIYCSKFVATKLTNHSNVHILPISGCTEVMGIQVRTGSNGHALGGLWFHFNAGRGIFYSGDYCLESDTYRFDSPPIAEIALLDTSYGNYDTPLSTQKIELMNTLEHAANKGSILLPVPASGRSIEIALWLNEWCSSTICFDQNGLEHINEALVENDTGLKETKKKQLKTLSQFVHAIQNISDIEPNNIVLAGSPDLDGGLVKTLISSNDTPINNIIFTGHIGMLAKQLCQQGEADFHRWNAHPTLTDTIRLAQHLQCQTLIPLFHPDLSTFQTHLFNCEIHTDNHWEPSYVTD
ncbi:MBL fold metallo-hydrolase [Vibrio sp. RC27]